MHYAQTRTQGGGSSPRAPLGFMSKGKNQVLDNKKSLPSSSKGVFFPLKRIVENFLGALRHLFSNFTVVFPFHLKSPPTPRILDKQL